MCGIVALLTPDTQVPRSLIDAMRDRLAHRGPDGADSWIRRVDGYAVALGHRRLSIIDLSDAGRQPMFAAEGKVAITYNGEIYNYIELRAELVREGVQFSTSSDTEVLLAAYLRWGVDCLPRLNGMFAFALWDDRSGQLFVARDRFGEKPLFYARPRDGGIAFASEMKALFAHPLIDARPNVAAIEAYGEGRIDHVGDDTFFEGVRKLGPASAMLVAPDGSVRRAWRYWTPDYTRVRPAQPVHDAAAELRHRLAESLKMRLRSDVRVGACLSGGLDSSMLVGLLAGLEARGHEVLNHTISARFDADATLSEGPYIDLMLAHVRRRGEFVAPDGADFAREARALHWHHEEPVASGSTYLEWCVQRRARQTGCPVMIDGQGSDELFGGYQGYFALYQLDLMRRGEWSRLARNTLRFNRRMQAEAGKYRDGERRFNARIALSLRWLLYLRLRGHDAARPTYPGVPPSADGHAFRWQRAFALLYESMGLQMHSADRNAMAFGVETRFPFLDHRLVDWCIALPEDLLVKDGWQKYLLRRAAEDVVPREIAWRVDKVGFAAPQDTWLRGGLKDWAAARLFGGALSGLPAFAARRAAIETLWREHQQGSRNGAGELWKWASLGEWLEMDRGGLWKQGMQASRDAARMASAA